MVQNKYNLKRQLKQRYFFFLAETVLAILAKRDLRLAAAFLCKMPLLTAISMTLYALFTAFWQASLEVVAAITCAFTVRTEVLQVRFFVWLRSATFTLLIADLILGTTNFS